jgi:hypothetical protein
LHPLLLLLLLEIFIYEHYIRIPLPSQKDSGNKTKGDFYETKVIQVSRGNSGNKTKGDFYETKVIQVSHGN